MSAMIFSKNDERIPPNLQPGHCPASALPLFIALDLEVVYGKFMGKFSTRCSEVLMSATPLDGPRLPDQPRVTGLSRTQQFSVAPR